MADIKPINKAIDSEFRRYTDQHFNDMRESRNMIKRCREGLYLAVIFALLLGFLVKVNSATVLDPSDPSFQCNVERQLNPELQWKKLKKGDRLAALFAILTCWSSSVTIKSNTSFFNSIIQWEQKNEWYLGMIPSEMLLVVLKQDEKMTKDKINVEVLDVSGEVFYSTSRGLLQKYGPTGSKNLKEAEKERQQEHKDLMAIGWEPLNIDRQLTDGDMIWTQENGRLEIEFINEGTFQVPNDVTDVRDLKGNLTLKRRYPANSYFIMPPLSKAKVNKVIGEVWVATDRGRVKQFEDKYHIGEKIGLINLDIVEWKEMLKKEELE